MKLKRFGLIASISLFTLLLSACVEVKGELGINSAARISGEITYKINKSLASAAGISSLDDVNQESNQTSSEEDGPCANEKFTEDETDFILKCNFANSISESGDIVAQLIGKSVYFRFKNNLDSSSSDSDITDFGSVSLTIRFADVVTSFKENKAGLVERIDDFTYRISGYATEPMDIEIVANCESRCGVSNSVLIPIPTQTLSAREAAERAADAANEATDAANRATDAAIKAAEEAEAEAAKILEVAEANAEATEILEAAKAEAAQILADARAAAELKVKQEADAKAAAELKVKQEADAKAAAELKAKQEAEAKTAAELKAKQEAANKKKTITCTKGKIIKKITALKPKCPKGYKVKK